VLKNWPVTENAVGLQSAENRRLFFFVPWRGAAMAGTYYRAHNGPLSGMRVSEADITTYLDMLNTCLPGVRLVPDDILTVQAGIMPTQGVFQEGREPVMLRHFQFTDHGQEGGPSGLYSVLGVKYTTARAAAEIAIDAIVRRCGLRAGPSVTRHTSITGGDTPDAAQLPAALRAMRPSMDETRADRLATLYGTEAAAIVKRAQQNEGPETCADALLRAEIGFVLEDEMPQSLGDLLYRRMGTANAGSPDNQHVRDCARLMGAARGWNAEREAREVKAVLDAPNLWQAACAQTP
jgi:glycerol-3-phosphate dehydrogenase